MLIPPPIQTISQSPILLKNTPFPFKIPNQTLQHTIIPHPLTHNFNHYHIPITPQNLLQHYHITPKQQHQFPFHSQQKPSPPQQPPLFDPQILPVQLPQPKPHPLIISQHQPITPQTTIHNLPQLPPPFKKHPSLTPPNPSAINHGPAAIL
ncbi:thiolase family protein, partial [Staphylococcus epidermidis]